jgi:hypothetical protein
MLVTGATSYDIVIDTSEMVSDSVVVMVEVTSSDGITNSARLIGFTHDGTLSQMLALGGPHHGDLLLVSNPADTIYVGDEAFLNHVGFRFDSLGTEIALRVAFDNIGPPVPGFPDEFSCYVLGPDLQARVHSSDPTGADALTVFCSTGGGSASATAYSPASVSSSGDSIYIVLPDLVAPKATVSLGADLVSSSAVGIDWYAPGDNGAVGTATAYDVRYATANISEATWGSAQQATGEPTPGSVGTYQYMGVSGLSSNTLYYFAIKTVDEAGNWSALSNVVSATTMSGGGLGESARNVGAGKRAAQREGATWEEGGSIVLEVRHVDGSPEWNVYTTDTAPGDSTRIDIILSGLSDQGVGTFEVSLAAFDSRIVVSGSRGPDRVYAVPGGPWAVTVGDEPLTAGGAPSGVSDREHPGERWLLGTGRGKTVEITRDVQATPSREGESAAVPSAFALAQNHPNPFGTATTIRFDLPKREQVRLEIFDAQGRRVARLANGWYPAGFHAVEWDRRGEGGRLQPGVYLYRIRAGAFGDQKKLVLLP